MTIGTTEIADELERGIDPIDIPAAEQLMDKAAARIRALEAALEQERARPIAVSFEDRMRWLRVERDAAVAITIERCAQIAEKAIAAANFNVAAAIRALQGKPDAE